MTITFADEKTTWTHPLGFEVVMNFDGRRWVCRCEALDIETTMQNQPPEDLARAVESWIDGHLHLKKASQIGGRSPVAGQTIWDIVFELIAGGDLVVAPRSEKVIFESGGNKVTLFHDRDTRLRLVIRNGGLPVTSSPIAYNPFSAPAGEWHLVDNVRQVYEDWVLKYKEASRD